MKRDHQSTLRYAAGERKAEKELDAYLKSINPPDTISMMEELRRTTGSK